MPEILIGIIPACFSRLIYGRFKLIGIQRLQKIVETIKLKSLYSIFIVGCGEYDGNRYRGIFQCLETLTVGKTDIRKDKVCCLS